MEGTKMSKLQYTFRTDTLFKMLFVKYPDLLRRLVAALLGITYESIQQFSIANPDITPEELGKKFCRLDINMTVNGQIVDLEIQVADEGNYPCRSLFYWAREFSTGINEGDDYSLLPRTIIISILGFNQFTNPQKFHSEFQCLEVTTHEPLTDKMILHFYELNKLPPLDKEDSGRELWLKLFRVETEEELTKIEEMGIPIMNEAIVAYRHIAASPELREAERMRSKARHDEAQALRNAEQRGADSEREKWQGVVADKDAALADKDAEIARLLARLGE
jgi:predicted transposase/invertase (TIGR01784 family)